MINLQFDISNIFMRSLFAISGFGQKSYTFDNQKELDELMRKVAMDTSFIIRGMNPARVIFTVDSKSWRKQIHIEENDGYKASREEKKVKLNWNNVYSVMDEFLSLANDYGFLVSKIDTAEADDIMALWSHVFAFDRNEHIISVSGDEDIRQLVFFNEEASTPAYATVFNPFLQGKNASRKLFIPAGFNNWVNKDDEEVSIWNMSASINPDKESFKRILTMDKTKFEEVDGRMIRLRKIFCGDDGDEIPSIFTWIIPGVDKNGDPKTARFTESKFDKLYEDLQSTAVRPLDYFNILEKKEKVLELLIKYTKQTPSFDIGTRLNRQIKLVALDPFVFPDSIKEKFEAEKDILLAKPRIDVASITMHNLLQGTRYVSSSYGGKSKTTGSEASIFGHLDRINMNKKLF